MTAPSPWSWIPDNRSWALSVAEAADRWSPDPALGLSAAPLRDAIAAAAERGGAAWLLHPCISRLTEPNPADARRDVILAAWVAGHTGCGGTVTLADPMILWSADGDCEVNAGRHHLADLGAAMMTSAPVAPALDLWCSTTGVVTAGSWASVDSDAFAAREAEAGRSIRNFLALMAALADKSPALTAWIAAATHVVRPLVPVEGVTRSSHDPGVPGLIEADLSQGPTQTIELVAHETAHLHLRAADKEAVLVDPTHRGTYHSPLRPEPRPLMGILLAYHALAYICAALQEARGAGLLDPEVVERATHDLGRRRDDARGTMDGARDHLTDAGARFLDRTHQVADHVLG